jgi:bifunctional DNA-binding transcriptional regulator/antitoxin component of YhaV-PrlF toxin-antitoxin module
VRRRRSGEPNLSLDTDLELGVGRCDSGCGRVRRHRVNLEHSAKSIEVSRVTRVNRQASGDLGINASVGTCRGRVERDRIKCRFDELEARCFAAPITLRSGKSVKQVSKLSSKHRVTIPVSILREAGLAAGDEVVIRASGHGRIEIERSDNVVRRFAGSLPPGTYPDGYLDELRGEWRE